MDCVVKKMKNLFFRGLAAGIYTTNSPEACYYVAHDCEANVLVVENEKQLEKILQVLRRKLIKKGLISKKGYGYPLQYHYD